MGGEHDEVTTIMIFVIVFILIAVFFFWMYSRWQSFKTRIWFAQQSVLKKYFPKLSDEEIHAKMMTTECFAARNIVQNTPGINRASFEQLKRGIEQIMDERGIIK